jgi:hypothetical protein
MATPSSSLPTLPSTTLSTGRSFPRSFEESTDLERISRSLVDVFEPISSKVNASEVAGDDYQDV